MAQATEDYKGATLPAAATDGTDEWGTALNTAQKLIIDTVVGTANESALNASGHTHKKISSANGYAKVDCTGDVTEFTGPSNFSTMPTVHVSDGLNGDKPLATQESVDAKEDKANKSTDGAMDANSDTLYPTQKAVRAYVANTARDGAAVHWIGEYHSEYQYSRGDCAYDVDTGLVYKSTIDSNTENALTDAASWEFITGLVAKKYVDTAVAGAGGTAIDLPQTFIDYQIEWDSGNPYAQHSVCKYNNKLYVSLVSDNSNQQPDNAYMAWSCIGIATNDYVDTAVAGKEDTSNKSIDGTLADNSDTKYPSQSAVKSYVDTAVAGAGGGSMYVPADTEASADVVGKFRIIVSDTTYGGTSVQVCHLGHVGSSWNVSYAWHTIAGDSIS